MSAHGDGHKSFAEIGAELGIEKRAAYRLFLSALRKLRKDERMRALLALAEERQALAGQRNYISDLDDDEENAA